MCIMHTHNTLYHITHIYIAFHTTLLLDTHTHMYSDYSHIHKLINTQTKHIPFASGEGLPTPSPWSLLLTLLCTSKAASLPIASLSTLAGLGTGLGSRLASCRIGMWLNILQKHAQQHTVHTLLIELTGLDDHYSQSKHSVSSWWVEH